jgi:dipeptidyl aminopeptidase/acylaminoacyl peptidase
MIATAIDRRALLRRAAAFGLVLPFAARPLAAAVSPELIPRRLFFGNPDCNGVRVSHDGKNLAYLAPLNGVENLWLAPVDHPQSGRPLTQVTDRNLGSYFAWAHTNRHVVYFQERDGDENWRASSIDIDTGAIVKLTPERKVRSFIQETDRKFPDQMLFRYNARDRRMFDLFRINVVTGASELVFENREYPYLLTDSSFRLRLGIRYARNGDAEVFERRDDGAWVPFTTVPIGDTDSTDFLEFSRDGATLYMLDSRGRDKAGLFAVDMATRERRLLAEDDEADIVWVTFSERRPLAAAAVAARTRWHAIDPEAAKDLDLLAAHGSGDIQFINRGDHSRKVVVAYYNDVAARQFALLDRATEKVEPLYAERRALAELPMRKMQPVSIAARDGLRMVGYLTLPQDGASRVPMVLLVHGGPYMRDLWGFSPTHQWLANRGYAVLSVNYRGSTGFGKAFVVAADRQWGGRMHDDLIDAVDWAIAQGVADPRRVGFFGGSYGGYSALMAATRTPDRFACIVDLFGISNLLTFMKTIPPYWGPEFSIWKNRLGDPDTVAGRAFLADRSPLNHIDRATKPILIAQGMRDVRVVPAESQQMVAALKAKGVPVTYITFRDEGHGFVREENRLAFNAVAEAFLAEHLGGRYQPIGDAFAGSTIKIETGAALIRGLG